MRKVLIGAIGLFGFTPMCALRFADGGGSGSGSGDGSGTGDGDPNNGGTKPGDGKGDDGGDGGEGDKKFSQSDVDAAVEKRLSRERKKWEREHNSQQQQQGAQQQQTPPAGDGGQQQQQQNQQPQQNQQAQNESAEKIAKANQRLVSSEAKTAAIAAGVKPDKVDYVVRLADLSKVDVDEDDGPDVDAIKKSIDKVLKDLPEFKAAKEDGNSGGSGFQIGADGSQGTQKQTQQAQNSNTGASKRWNRFR